MVWIMLAMASIAVFCMSAHFFVRAVTESPVVFRTADFSVTALRVQRWYRVFSWGLVSLILLFMLVREFINSVAEVL